MSSELDCRGMSCPAPVLHVRDFLGKEVPTVITILVDNEAARQNVSRFLESQSFQVNSERQGDGFLVVGAKDGVASAFEKSSKTPVKQELLTVKKVMVLITSEHMGHGDDGLGDMLMFNYLKTLKEMGPELWRVVFVNSGVKYTADGSEAVPILQELTREGIQILACGACLAYFHILDKLVVGEVSNMLEIVTSMKLADSVISI